MICEDPVRLIDEYGQETCKREHLKMLVSERYGERTRNSGWFLGSDPSHPMHNCRFQSTSPFGENKSEPRDRSQKQRIWHKWLRIAELVSRNMSQKQKAVVQELSWSTILAKRPISGAVNGWIERLQSRRVRYEGGRGCHKDLILECISIVVGCMKPARSIGVPSEAVWKQDWDATVTGLKNILFIVIAGHFFGSFYLH